MTCSPGQDTLVMGIASKGRTIPAEALQHLFEVFFLKQVAVPWNDIGLAPSFAERIVRLFGGSITVENQESPGIIFRVALTAVEAA